MIEYKIGLLKKTIGTGQIVEPLWELEKITHRVDNPNIIYEALGMPEITTKQARNIMFGRKKEDIELLAKRANIRYFQVENEAMGMLCIAAESEGHFKRYIFREECPTTPGSLFYLNTIKEISEWEARKADNFASFAKNFELDKRDFWLGTFNLGNI